MAWRGIRPDKRRQQIVQSSRRVEVTITTEWSTAAIQCRRFSREVTTGTGAAQWPGSGRFFVRSKFFGIATLR